MNTSLPGQKVPARSSTVIQASFAEEPVALWGHGSPSRPGSTPAAKPEAAVRHGTPMRAVPNPQLRASPNGASALPAAMARSAGAPGAPGAGAPGSIQARLAAAVRGGHTKAVLLADGFFGANRGTGHPLPTTLLRKMEARFGADFSDVRIHITYQPTQIGALAITAGTDLYFAPGQYQPMTASGEALLCRQLSRVLQQRSGQVRNPFGHGVALVPDLEPPLRSPTLPNRNGGAPAVAVTHNGTTAWAAQPKVLERSRTAGPGFYYIATREPFPRTAFGTREEAEEYEFGKWPPEEFEEAGALLRRISHALFTATKSQVGALMEVQAGHFDGFELKSDGFIASNYANPNDGAKLSAILKGAQQKDGTPLSQLLNRLPNPSEFVTLNPFRWHPLHAEQQILLKLAQLLAKENPGKSSVTVIGTKRPCWVCRRVLLAFHAALQTVYPDVSLHFVNKTGKDVDAGHAGVLDLDELALSVRENEQFNTFVKKYKELLKEYLETAKLDNENAETNSARTLAEAQITDLC